MKKTMFIIAVAMFVSGAVFTGCQSNATKVENANDKVDAAKDKVETAQKELDKAISDSIRQFKKESENKIMAFDNKIAEIKVKIAKENREARANDERRLASLEQQNREMRQNLEDFNEARAKDWDSFRAKFRKDMEEQGKAFRDFWGIRR